MERVTSQLISVIVPVYNEGAGLHHMHTSLVAVLDVVPDIIYEIIYCDDGSIDATAAILNELATTAKGHVKVVSLSRNFGKEIAVTAGMHVAKGQAIITLDGDGQHPVELIPQFVTRWRAGAKVVVGKCILNPHASRLKRFNSRMFYEVFNRITGSKVVLDATDFRLIDQIVQRDFNKMTERSRITRGMVDWLGYKPVYIEFKANPRLAGVATYSTAKLIKLSIDGVVSLSTAPLQATIYVGLVILPVSILLGCLMVANALIGDPFGWDTTGSAYVVVLLLFLVGLLTVSQGIMGLYLSHIHTETQNRPLYIIDYTKSIGLE
jgi:polyisoprenyl-phosphate glycosyltransferase